MPLLCDRLEELSIEYLRGDLNSELQANFENHLQICQKCKYKFLLIKKNFKTVLTQSKLPMNFNNMVMNSIDKSRYMKTQAMKLRKRLILTTAVLLTLGIITGFSEPLGQKIDNLIYKLQGHKWFKGFETRSMEGRLNLEKAKEIFEKYTSEVDVVLSNMKPGEVKTLELKEEAMEDLYLKLYKGDTNDVVNLCINDEELRVKGESTVSFGINSSTVDTVIQQGTFIALFDPLPSDNAVVSVVDIDNATGSLHVFYHWDNTNFAGIQLSPSATLSKGSKKEIINIQQFEAIYEDNASPSGKEGQITLYLGENKLLKALVLIAKYTDTMNKERFIALANTIKFYNEDANMIKSLTPENFFLGVLDTRVEKHYAEFINTLNISNKNFNIKIADGVKLEGYEKTKENRNYALVYNNKSLNELSKHSNYPLLVHRDLFDKASEHIMRIEGQGYLKSKTAHGSLSFKVGKKIMHGGYLITEYVGRAAKYTPLDIIMDDLSGWGKNVDLFFDKSSNPYIVYKTSDAVVFRTITTIENRHVLYQIFIPEEMLQKKNYETFINELQVLN
jgi:hypothetical protein